MSETKGPNIGTWDIALTPQDVADLESWWHTRPEVVDECIFQDGDLVNELRNLLPEKPNSKDVEK